MHGKRLKILSKAEINDLYDIPRFTTCEKQTYFSLSEQEHNVMVSRGSLASKVHFILQLGYFKAAAQFFNCAFHEVQDDVDFILQEHLDKSKLKIKNISKQTRQSNQVLILSLLGYNGDKAKIKSKLSSMLAMKVQHCSSPIFMFHEILSYSNQHKLMLLGYSTLQDLIGSAIVNEESRLGSLLQKHLSKDAGKAIENILTAKDDTYVLTALKQDPKSFKHKQIVGEIKKLEEQKTLYNWTKFILPKLKLSNLSINYYADLAAHYPISRLNKLTYTMRSIYILCYVHQRYQKINDNLMASYFHYMKKFNDEAKIKARDHIINEKLEINESSKQAAIVLRFFDDENISDDESFGKVRQRAYKHIKKGRFLAISDYLEGVLFDYQKTKWDETAKLANKVAKNIRPIFKSLEFAAVSGYESITSAIQFLKNYFIASANIKKEMLEKTPIACIPKLWKPYLAVAANDGNENDKIIDIKKYEFMVYQLMMLHVESGHLYLDDSISFKSLSSHLVSDKKWQAKNALLKKLDNKKLLLPIDKLMLQLEDELETLINTTNQRIKSGDNKGITIKQNGDEITFTLPYPKFADKANHPIFKQLTQISIAEVLQFAQKECDFMHAFTHIKPYHAQDMLDPIAIMDCVIANATNLGIHKMAETSDLNYHRMQSQMKNFIRLETLREANNSISNSIAKLSIFKYWDIHNHRIHGSVDGQKFETRIHSFIARYSSKYFGINKGVVSYTLCANHIPVSARIISANHHESHYLFDILFNNNSNVDISWLSGDGHSINQVNFALLDFIEKQFAPYFKRINQKIDTLHGFKSLNHYNELLIKPKNKINKKLIESEWDNIQRIIVSLLFGETSQHLIVSKLSSYKYKNRTKAALWEYDKILMSIYMLNFINDPMIRQNVRRALNRGEAYHQLRRAIANVHGRKFRGTSEQELELWNECARLTANCIIYYHTRFLDALLTKLQANHENRLIEQLEYISPVAWQHINLYGYYTFERNPLGIVDMANLAERINMLKL